MALIIKMGRAGSRLGNLRKDMQLSYAKKQNILLFIFFGLLALSLFSPIASNEYIPNSTDFSNHIVNIIEAKQALEEGQFPVRIAPSLYNGWRYPYYQFYSPVTYTLGGAIYKWLTPNNPFLAFKMVLWIFLVIGGFYIFRLTKEFVSSDGAAFLASVIYLMSPYLIVDIGARGDLTEAVAACIVPMVLYYNIRFQRWPSLTVFLSLSFAWFLLATVHILIFLCSIVFIGLFLIAYNINEFLPLKRLCGAIIALTAGCLLALWYFVPMLMLLPHLYAHYVLTNPFDYRWLSPISTLLSASSVSPMPLPGNGRLQFPFNVSFGWPILTAVSFIIYKKVMEPQNKIPHFVNTLLFLFFVGFIIIWSPVNFWKFLPEYSKSVQVSARFLIQLMWIGALLFAWAVSNLFQNKLDIRHVVVGVLLIAIANGVWLQTNKSAKYSVAEIIQDPKLNEWGASSFVVRADYTKYQAVSLPVEKTSHLCHQESMMTRCQFTINQKQKLQLPVLFYPDMLEIKVNGRSVSYEPTALQALVSSVYFINPMLATIKLSPGNYTVTAQYIGVRWANYLSISAWIIFLLLGIFLIV